MPIMDKVTTEKTSESPRKLVYGPNGVGKSKYGTTTPDPIFVPTEDGLGQYKVAKFPVAKSFDEVMSYLSAIRDEKHDFKTVVLDTADWLERLIHDKVCNQFGASNIERVDGGYGRGYVHALGYWRKVLAVLDEIRTRRKMIVLILAHCKVERFEDPENASYDRYCPRLQKLANALLCEWADAVLFATQRMRVDAATGKATPIGADGGQRVLRCIGGPACVAKNRFDLPAEIDLSWQSFVDNIGKGATHA